MPSPLCDKDPINAADDLSLCGAAASMQLEH
jgi:hypothetical protein